MDQPKPVHNLGFNNDMAGLSEEDLQQLKNLGENAKSNNCFINSVLQALYHTQFKNFIMDKEKPQNDSLEYVLQDVFTTLDGREETVDSSELRKNLRSQIFLDKLDELGEFLITENEQQSEYDFLKNLFKKINDKFLFNNKYKIQNDRVGQTFPEELDKTEETISLMIRDEENENNLLDLLNNHIEKENFPEITEENKIASTQKVFNQFANILILHVQRAKINDKKWHNPIKFEEIIDMKNFLEKETLQKNTKCKLKAFISHKGTGSKNGHYMCFAKESDNNWYLYNDDVATLIPDEVMKYVFKQKIPDLYTMKIKNHLDLLKKMQSDHFVSPIVSYNQKEENKDPEETIHAHGNIVVGQEAVSFEDIIEFLKNNKDNYKLHLKYFLDVTIDQEEIAKKFSDAIPKNSGETLKNSQAAVEFFRKVVKFLYQTGMPTMFFYEKEEDNKLEGVMHRIKRNIIEQKIKLKLVAKKLGNLKELLLPKKK